MIYLAIPYSHSDPKVREERFQIANKIACGLIQAGEHVFSPISHTHPIAEHGDLPRGWDYWEAYDTAMIRNCHKMVVVCVDGWLESIGVQAEIKIALSLGISVEYLFP